MRIITKPSQSIALPPAFIQRISDQIDDWKLLLDKFDTEPPVAVRLNKVKIQLARDISYIGEAVPWSQRGIYLSSRPSYRWDPNYHLGVVYPMDASSMLLEFALKNISLPGDSQILDLCAAPGGKTLILKDCFPASLLVSNEIDRSRCSVLLENSLRWGTTNHLIIQSSAGDIARTDVAFDLILADVPCSGEGLFRKQISARKEWTPEKASGCAFRQKQILRDVLPLVKNGGYFIYSTCTFNPEENLNLLTAIREEHEFKSLRLDLPQNWGIEEQAIGNFYGYQCWPHRMKGEGFFISVFQKSHSAKFYPTEESKPNTLTKPSALIPESLSKGKIVSERNGVHFLHSADEFSLSAKLKTVSRIIRNGLELGQVKTNNFIPSHALAMAEKANDLWPEVEIEDEKIISFLKGNSLTHITNARGIVRVTWNGITAGFGKSVGSRINNLIHRQFRAK